MALRPYTNRIGGGLDIGSDTFSAKTNNSAAISEGFSRLGAGITSYGEDTAKGQIELDKKAQSIQDRSDGYRDEMEYIRIKDQVQQFEINQRDKGADDLNGHTKAVDEFARKAGADALASGRLSAKDPARHELMIERLRNSVVDKAAETEAKARSTFRETVGQQTLEPLVATAALKGVAGREEALKGWTDFIDRTEGMNSRVGRAMASFGARRIDRAAVEYELATKGPEAISKIQGMLSETPSATTANPMVNAALKYAPSAGVDPKVAVAIGWIESRLRADHGAPIGKDGKPMSSAEGGWQIIDQMKRQFGLDRTGAYDPEKATPQVMAHFSENQKRIEALGQEVTPGKTYMYWNVGQGVADKILRADPNTPIEQIIASAYPTRPGLAAQVLRNNPSMYHAGMTAGQVLDNYESKMANATKATSAYFGATQLGTDEQVRSAIKDITGLDTPHVNTKDLADMFVSISAKIKDKTQAQIDLEAGMRLLGAPGTADPYDKTDKSLINKAVEEQYGNQFLQGIPKGDPVVHASAVKITTAAGFIPDKVVHGFRAALDGGDSNARMHALNTLANIYENQPKQFKATGLKSDDVESVENFRVYTQAFGLSEAQASERIKFERSPEGEQLRKSNAERFKAEWRNGGTEIDADNAAWSKIQKKFDGSVLSTPDVATDAQRNLLTDAYQRGVTYHRLRGLDQEHAKERALDELSGAWGVSSVANSGKSKHLMMLPPEKVLGPNGKVDGSYSWVKKMADETLTQHLTNIGQIQKDDPNDTAKLAYPILPEYRLVPSEGSLERWRRGDNVSYSIHYKDAKGRIQTDPRLQIEMNPYEAKTAEAERFAAARATGIPQKKQLRDDYQSFILQRD